MKGGDLGKVYEDGEVIVTAGEPGECMYVVQEGRVEVFVQSGGGELRLAVREKGDFFGEMAIFEKELRSASVRALGRTRVLTIDRRNLMKRINEDPSLAFRIIETMSGRIRELSEEVSRIKGGESPQ